MAISLSNEIRALLDGPNFAHLATLMPDGSPQSVPVWVGREGDRILICTGEGSMKAKNTLRDPRVALSIVGFHDPYQEAQLRGRVVERHPDGNFKYMDTRKSTPASRSRSAAQKGELRLWSRSRKPDIPSSVLNIRHPDSLSLCVYPALSMRKWIGNSHATTYWCSGLFPPTVNNHKEEPPLLRLYNK
jgi:PPOX class probable F420-dependent enzyme